MENERLAISLAVLLKRYGGSYRHPDAGGSRDLYEYMRGQRYAAHFIMKDNPELRSMVAEHLVEMRSWYRNWKKEQQA